MLERTLVLLKPDCVEARIIGKILTKIEDAGLILCGCKFMQLTPEVLREHYSHILQYDFYPRVEEFMLSSPVVALVIEGKNAVSTMRSLLGPTDSQTAPRGTIRGDYGADKTRNIAHASDSVDNAEFEIGRFFRKEEVFDR